MDRIQLWATCDGISTYLSLQKKNCNACFKNKQQLNSLKDYFKSTLTKLHDDGTEYLPKNFWLSISIYIFFQ